MAKNEITTPDFDRSLRAGVPTNGKKQWFVETTKTVYWAHELDDVMRLWKEHDTINPVINVGSVW